MLTMKHFWLKYFINWIGFTHHLSQEINISTCFNKRRWKFYAMLNLVFDERYGEMLLKAIRIVTEKEQRTTSETCSKTRSNKLLSQAACFFFSTPLVNPLSSAHGANAGLLQNPWVFCTLGNILAMITGDKWNFIALYYLCAAELLSSNQEGFYLRPILWIRQILHHRW